MPYISYELLSDFTKGHVVISSIEIFFTILFCRYRLQNYFKPKSKPISKNNERVNPFCSVNR